MENPQINQILAEQKRRTGLTVFFGVVLVIIALLNFGVVKSNLPLLSAIGPRGETGKSEAVEYEKIYEHIDAKIAEIPRATNGKDGRDGVDGRDGSRGADGASCTTEQTPTGASVTCPDGSQSNINNGESIVGPQGPAGKQIELRHNNNKNRLEWRYVGDENWTVLVKDCIITNSCTL